ncbi:MAG: hypothetical protein ABJD11_18605 [Gemmatimonadota bacterium]
MSVVPANRSSEQWTDDGYAYSVAFERHVDAITIDVSRRLAAGRMSPVVGQRVFLFDEEELLTTIVNSTGSARTMLADRVIRGEPFSLQDIR